MKKDSFDELVVVKRSGQRVNFNSYKIAIAIKSAYDYVYNKEYDESEVNKIYENVLHHIIENYSDRKTINVEDIQDIIETEMKKESESAYKAFSEYRQKRAESRKMFKVKQQHKFAKAMETLAEGDILKGENNYSPEEVLLECGKTVTQEYAKAYLLDNKYLRAHEEGKIYIHDIDTFFLGKLSHTHLMLDKRLEVDDSIDNLATYILDVKKELSGEVNIPSIDFLLDNWLLEKFKKQFKDYIENYLSLNGFSEYINIKKIKDKIDRAKSLEIDIDEFESNPSNMVHNIFETAYKDTIRKIEGLIGESIGRLFKRLIDDKEKRSYSVSFGLNKSKVGVIINRAILDYIEINEDNKELSFIYKVSSLDGDILLRLEELILKGKDIFIDFEAKTEVNIEHFSNGVRIYENTNDDEPSSIGRSIVASTSINMSRLALENRGKSRKEFMGSLDETLDLVKNELLMAFETIGNKNKDNYRYLFDGNIRNDEKLLEGQKVRKVIKDGVLNIGVVGLKECINTLETEPIKQYELAVEILKHLDKRCEEYSLSTKLNFALMEPCKGNSSKEFMTVDKTIYGIIKGITENHKYDLISNHEYIRKDYNLLSKISLFFKGGHMIEYEISKNSSVSKIHKDIEKFYMGNIKFVRFTKDRWFKT